MGDVIGDHTETHPMMAELSASDQQSEIVDQTEWVRKYRGPFPRLWRPPYGSYNATTLAILREQHMLMVLWTVDTDDYLRPGVSAIVDKALAGARPGAIILMHDAGGDRTQTISALPLIVRALRDRGYKLVTVPQLILDDPPRHAQRLPTRLSGD
jgi:peptidoglycan-N-acetylglucosamine deacetylase